MELNAEVIVSFVSKLADAKGHHFAIGKTLATAIVKWATALPLSKGVLYTGMLLATMSTYESGNRVHARGDGGRSYCALQVQNCGGYPCAELLKDADKCVEAALKIMHRSEENCPNDPIAMYASGKCPGRGENEKNNRAVWISVDRSKKLQDAFQEVAGEEVRATAE